MREPRAKARATGAAPNGELVTPPSLGVGKKERGDGVRLSTAASRRSARGAREQSAVLPCPAPACAPASGAASALCNAAPAL